MLGAVDSSETLESRNSIKIIAICSRVSCEDWAVAFGTLKVIKADRRVTTKASLWTTLTLQGLALCDNLPIMRRTTLQSTIRSNITHSEVSTRVPALRLTVFIVKVAAIAIVAAILGVG